MSERIYVIVPRNLDVIRDGKMSKLSMTCGRAMGHSNHASNMLGMAGIDSFDMDMVTLSVADLVELHEVRLMMAGKDIRFIEYEDEDRLYDGKVVTALITYPLDGTQVLLFKKYPAWRCKCNEVLSSRSSVAEHSTDSREAVGSGASQTAVGSIPTGSANLQP